MFLLHALFRWDIVRFGIIFNLFQCEWFAVMPPSSGRAGRMRALAGLFYRVVSQIFSPAYKSTTHTTAMICHPSSHTCYRRCESHTSSRCGSSSHSTTAERQRDIWSFATGERGAPLYLTVCVNLPGLPASRGGLLERLLEELVVVRGQGLGSGNQVELGSGGSLGGGGLGGLGGEDIKEHACGALRVSHGH